MADVSKFEMNGTIYNVKDIVARNGIGEIESLKLRVDSAEEDIADVKGDLLNLDDKIDDSVTDLEGSISEVNTKATTAVNTANSAKNDIGRVAERATSLEFRANELEADVSDLKENDEKQDTKISNLTEYAENVNSKSDDNAEALAVLEARMDEFSSLPDGSTSGDAELQDIRVGFTGKTYSSAGNAVRGQAKMNNDALVEDNTFNLLDLFATYRNLTSAGVTYTWDGDTVTVNGTATANGSCVLWNSNNGIPPYLEKGKKYRLKIKQADNVIPYRVLPSIVFLGSTNTYLYPGNEETIFEIPNDCTGVTIRVYHYNGNTFNNVQIRFGIYEYEAFDNKTLYSLATENDNVFEQYTDYELLSGYWNIQGRLTEGGLHSEYLKVRPNTDYYTPDNLDGYEDLEGIVALFDANKSFIGRINRSEFVEVNYRLPDPTGNYTNYASIWKFTTPENCHYISLNARNVYRRGVVSKPAYTVWLSGNLIIKKDNASYQKKKDKNLCVIGTSNVMIDRLGRSGNFTPPFDETPVTQFICGFQEYLIPWYKNVESYGYSNTTFVANRDGNVGTIYKYIVTNRLNLSGYDDFMICCSSVGVDSDNIGTLTSPHDLGDMYTYMGSIRQLIEYIYSQNANANIYLLARYNRPAFNSDSYYENQKLVNEATREIGELLSIPVIDAAKDSGFNEYNADKWCYDANGHYNHYGNKEFGLYVRKQIVGI